MRRLFASSPAVFCHPTFLRKPTNGLRHYPTASNAVVVMPPAFNEHLCLLQRVEEDLAVERLVAKLAMKLSS